MLLGLQAREFRKLDVIADEDAEPAAFEVEDAKLVAWRVERVLPRTEELDLAVHGQRAVRRDQER